MSLRNEIDLNNVPHIEETAIMPGSRTLETQTSLTTPLLTQPPANDDKISAKDQDIYFTCWIQNGKYLGDIPEAIVDHEFSTGNADYDLQFDGMIDKIGGFVIGTFFHGVLRSRYKKSRGMNPLYRNFKTLATAGTQAGMFVYELRLLPQILATAIFALGIGLMALPYWLYREYYHKKTAEEIAAEESDTHYKLGREGWSKYGKTFLVLGMYVGEVIGTFVSFLARGNYLQNIAIFGAAGSIAMLITGAVIVPLINKIFAKKLITTADTFRNNYVRSGITFGLAVGTVLGFVLGTVIFPGLGSLAGMAVGGAICSVIGGVTLAFQGKSITQYLQAKWNVKTTTQNSWDYSTRNLSYLFGFIGAAIGFFVPVPGGAVVGAALGSAIGSAVGWGAGFLVIHQARKICPVEPHTSIPWSQRLAGGTMGGSMLGAAIGFCLGWAGGPAGALIGATIGFSIGAVIGGLVYGLNDKVTRNILRQYFTRQKIENVDATPLLEPVQESLAAAPAYIIHESAPVSITLPEVKALETISRPATSATVIIRSLQLTKKIYSPAIDHVDPPTLPQAKRNLTLVRCGSFFDLKENLHSIPEEEVNYPLSDERYVAPAIGCNA